MPFDVVGRVLENRALVGGYFLTTLDAPDIAATCEPGQFVMAGTTDPSELLLRRPFSVCLVGRGGSGAGEPRSAAGRATAGVEPGTSAAGRGPDGAGTRTSAAGRGPDGAGTRTSAAGRGPDGAPASSAVGAAAGAPAFSTLSLLYRSVGRGTGYLSRLVPGDEAALLGPLGHGFSAPREGESPVVVAGGVGIAAFPFFMERLAAAGRPAHLLYGGRTSQDLPMLDWLKERAASVTVTTDDGSAGARGLVTAALERRLDEGRSRDRLYVCGPHAMMKAAAAIATGRGIACEVALETPMACGYGVCVGCVVEVHDFQGEYGRYRRVCVDGPVMDAREIRW